MKRLIIILICLTLGSCSIFKRTTKNKEVEQVSSHEKINSDSTGTIVDKTKTVIKETADTVIKTPEKSSTTETKINIDSLINGITAIKNDLFVVKLDYNPVTKILTTKATALPRLIPVKFNRETTINKDVTQTSATKDAIVRDEKKKVVKVNKVKEPAKMGIWLIAVIVGICLVIGSVWYWLKKR